MPLSRRRVLQILLAVAAAAATGAAVYRRALRAALRTMLAPGVRWLTTPAVERSPAGPLDAAALNTLLAAATAFAAGPIEQGHYADFFRWHAENLPGYKALYERFAASVEGGARRALGCDFATCDAAGRRRILEPAYRVLRARGRLEKIRLGLFERTWVRFALYVVGPMAGLFASTDAWRLAGYEAWPGTPRGLENYTRAPR